MTDARLVAQLHAASLFRGIDIKQIESLAPHCSRRRLRAGDYIWRRGDVAQSFIVVEKGLIAIQRGTAEGDNVLVALFGPGDTLCVVPALQRLVFPADAIAITEETEVLVIAAAPLLKAIGQNAELTGAVNRALLDHTTSLRHKIDIVSVGTVPRRVAVLLLYMAERFGRKSNDGTVEIHPALTREQIGQLVNARTETVIRIMSRWSKAGWIRGTAPRLQLLRIDMLQRMARAAAGTPSPGAASPLD